MIKYDRLRIYRDDLNRAIFEIDGSKTYYMSSSYNKFIIINADYFDKQWKKSEFDIQKVLANIEDKHNDIKYKQAEIGFQSGRDNPVPIVNVKIMMEDEINIIPTLENGLTRTNYLLANNVKYLVFGIDSNESLTDTEFYFLIKNSDIK